MEIVCSKCGKRVPAKPKLDGSPKLPRNWKQRRADEKVFCANCWRSIYLLRALSFQVVKPLSGTWQDLESALKPMWILSTAASNWIMTTLYSRDCRRGPTDTKMPAMQPVYLYPEVRREFPGLPPQSVVSLSRVTEAIYRHVRYDVVWTHSASLPSLRYPQPFRLHNQSWTASFSEDNRPVLSVRIGDSRWILQLKGGPRYWRQIKGLRCMEEQGELAILKAHDGSIRCKLVGYLSREKERTDQGPALFVRTGKDCLLIATDARDNRAWIENADHLPRLMAAARRQRQRFSEDRKAEQRPIASFQDRSTGFSRKYANRVKSAIQESASHLAAFAERRHFAKVTYNDEDRWLEDFPYFMMETAIRQKLDERGIEFEKQKASGAEEKKDGNLLAEE